MLLGSASKQVPVGSEPDQ